MSVGDLPLKNMQGGTEECIEVDLLDLVEFADRLKSRRVIAEGMVAWDKSDNNRFYLFRFVIWCCVADAQPIAALVECNEIERPRQTIWVRVEGLADIIKVGGETGVIIRKASAASIRAPKDPYLY